MTFEIERSPKFERRVEQFRRRHPEAVRHLVRVISDLEEDPHKPQLRLHSLVGKLSGYQAVWINYQLRLVIALDEVEGVVTLIDIGTHDEVYR